MKFACARCFLLLACLAPAGAEPAPLAAWFDAHPANSAFVTASQSPAVAWTSSSSAGTSIWLAEGAELKPRPVYLAPDDGAPLSELTLSPDGRWLAWVRGSRPNAQGEISNPLNAPDPAERSLWLLATAGGTPRRLAGGASPAVSSPAFSPDGQRLAFTRGREVWVAGLTAPAEPARAFTIRGRATQLAWSPDSRQLAFVSDRRTHSFVGLFDFEARTIRYLEPGLEQDRTPVWAPDGRHLAFVRVREPVQRYRFMSARDGVPWSLMVADLPSGTVRTRWTADPGPGSALGEMAVDLMVTDDQLVFSWEKTGWRQLYRLSLDGASAPVRLTSGDGEIWFPTLASDRRHLYFQSNARSRERFDLHRLDLAGGGSDQLAENINGFGVLPDARVVFNGYTTGHPPDIRLANSSNASRTLWTPPAAITVVEPEVVELHADDGGRSHALLFRPASEGRAHRRPAVVYAHGGSRTMEALLSDHPSNRGLVQALVARGFVVLVPNYRSGVGYGLDFREAPGYGGGGGTDVLDILAAGRFLASQPEVDPARLGLFGISYGGYLTTAALARAPDLWAAGVSIVGVGDWQLELEYDAGGAPLPFRTSERMKFEDLAHQSSANADLARWRAPILFISADDDQEGWLDQSIQLGQSLRARGLAVEAYVEPGGTHRAATSALLVERGRRTIEFFERQLVAAEKTVTSP